MGRSNGPGFGSHAEAARFHAQRNTVRQTNLDYGKYGPHPPRIPLDGDLIFQQTHAAEQARESELDRFAREADPGYMPPTIPAEAPVPQSPVVAVPKSLKEIAMEQGQIPRRRD